MASDWLSRDVIIDAVAGFAAGAACTLVFQPIDTILTRQQYEVARRSAGAAATVVLKQGGYVALWRGATPRDPARTACLDARRGSKDERNLSRRRI